MNTTEFATGVLLFVVGLMLILLTLVVITSATIRYRRKGSGIDDVQRRRLERNRIMTANSTIYWLQQELGDNDPAQWPLSWISEDLRRYDELVRKDGFALAGEVNLTELIHVLKALEAHEKDRDYMTNSWIAQQAAFIVLKRELFHLARDVHKSVSRAVQMDQAQSIGTRELVANRQRERRLFRSLERK